MLAKNWKRIGIFILIIVCLVSIIVKLMKIETFSNAIEDVKTYISSLKTENKK